MNNRPWLGDRESPTSPNISNSLRSQELFGYSARLLRCAQSDFLLPVPTKTTTKPKGLVAVFVAGGQGVEPQLTDSKSGVLPLDDPPTIYKVNITKFSKKYTYLNGFNKSNRKILERSERFFPLDDPPTISQNLLYQQTKNMNIRS